MIPRTQNALDWLMDWSDMHVRNCTCCISSLASVRSVQYLKVYDLDMRDSVIIQTCKAFCNPSLQWAGAQRWCLCVRACSVSVSLRSLVMWFELVWL